MKLRYYDPMVGRFFNADEVIFATVNGNLFAYCGNEPVNMSNAMGFAAGRALAVSFASSTAIAGSANAWNPVGLVLLEIALLIAVGTAIFMENRLLKEQAFRIGYSKGKLAPLPSKIF